jgi:hypothetical protein
MGTRSQVKTSSWSVRENARVVPAARRQMPDGLARQYTDRPHCQYEQHAPYDVCMLVQLPWRPRRAIVCLACHPLPAGWPVKAKLLRVD